MTNRQAVIESAARALIETLYEFGYSRDATYTSEAIENLENALALPDPAPTRWKSGRTGRITYRDEDGNVVPKPDPAPKMPEPVYWQWRRKSEAWDREFIFRDEVHATTEDSEVRMLFAAPVAAQGEAVAVKEVFLAVAKLEIAAKESAGKDFPYMPLIEARRALHKLCGVSDV